MRLYLDTSIFGGYFEDEFSEWTVKLIDRIVEGDDVAVISDITLRELENAPDSVRNLSERVIQENAELVEMTDEAEKLSQNYIKEKVVTQKYFADAVHIAIATINKVDVLVSWNFHHIVNLKRIRLYNSVNLKYGYTLLEIRSPREIVDE
jgi:predicted nucleic acid-binding protein